MRRLLGYCLAQASAAGNRVFDERIGSPLALRRIDYTILVLVDANPDATNRQLARLLGVSMPYLTITLDKLVARGLVTRTRSELDRRSSLLRLTDEGRSLLREAEHIVATMESALLAHLTAGEAALLFELLIKVWTARHKHPLRALHDGAEAAAPEPETKRDRRKPAPTR
ncbi:MAG: MarR family transcriptional regulator [Rhizobacter sp.]|nr:MarR family transcriptional regulator [Rhizobacter sp.]